MAIKLDVMREDTCNGIEYNFVNKLFDIDDISIKYGNTYDLTPNGDNYVYLSNYLIYNISAFKSLYSISGTLDNASSINNLFFLFMYGNNNNHTSSLSNDTKCLYNKTSKQNCFLDTIYYDSTINASRMYIPICSNNTDAKFYKFDATSMFTLFPFLFPRPIDCVSIKNPGGYVLSLYYNTTRYMSFNDPNLTFNEYYYNESSGENYYRIYPGINSIFRGYEPQYTDEQNMWLLPFVQYTQIMYIYSPDDCIYCDCDFYIFNNLLPSSSPLKNYGTSYQWYAIFDSVQYQPNNTSPILKAQKIYTKKFKLTCDNLTKINANDIVNGGITAQQILGSSIYSDIHFYFYWNDQLTYDCGESFCPNNTSESLLYFLTLNSANVNNFTVHNNSGSGNQDYTHSYSSHDGTMSLPNASYYYYRFLFIIAIAKNNIMDNYQAILVGTCVLNNLIYKIGNNTSFNLTTNISPKEAMRLYKKPVINISCYDYYNCTFSPHITSVTESGTTLINKYYPISSDIGGISYYYDDVSGIPGVYKIQHNNSLLSSVLYQNIPYGSNIYGLFETVRYRISEASNNEYYPDSTKYTFSCMTEIPWYEFNFNAYEYGEGSYGYSYSY